MVSPSVRISEYASKLANVDGFRGQEGAEVQEIRGSGALGLKLLEGQCPGGSHGSFGLIGLALLQYGEAAAAEETSVIVELLLAFHDVRGSLLQGQGQAAQALGYVFGGNPVGLAGTAKQECDGAFERQLMHVLGVGARPGLHTRGHEHSPAGAEGQVGLERAGCGGVVENEQDMLALREPLAHLANYQPLIGNHCHAQLRG